MNKEFNDAMELKTIQCLLFFLIGVGSYKVICFFFRIFKIFFDTSILRSVDLKKYGAHNGNWAVITGASDGIGKQFALQLAAKKFNVILLSRSAYKLDLLTQEIILRYDVECKSLSIDFSKASTSEYLNLTALIKDLPISVLINNVGCSHSVPVPFLETGQNELKDIIIVNNLSVLNTTQIVGEIILKTVYKENRKIKGLILTMGSFAGLIPTPLLATYSGSKAFLQAWSNALAGELKDKGVDVQLTLSYLVTTSMSKISKRSFTVPSTQSFVKSALNLIGRRGGAHHMYSTSTPHFSHALIQFLLAHTVGFYSKITNNIVLKLLCIVRKKALRKKKRLESQKNK